MARRTGLGSPAPSSPSRVLPGTQCDNTADRDSRAPPARRCIARRHAGIAFLQLEVCQLQVEVEALRQSDQQSWLSQLKDSQAECLPPDMTHLTWSAKKRYKSLMDWLGSDDSDMSMTIAVWFRVAKCYCSLWIRSNSNPLPWLNPVGSHV